MVSICLPDESFIIPEKDKPQTDQSDVWGFSLKELGLRSVHQEIELNDESAAIVGQYDDISAVLVLANKVTGKVETLATFSDAERSYLKSKDYVGLLKFKPQIDQNIFCLIVIYFLDHSGMKEEDAEVMLRVFLIRGNEINFKSGPFQIGRRDILYNRVSNTNSAWLVSSADDSSKPAIKSDSRILLKDANMDGFLDIIIWQKIFKSVAKVDVPDEKDFERYTEFLKKGKFSPYEERLLVMLFDPDRGTFADPAESKILSTPQSKLWDTLPGVGRTELTE